MRTGQSSTYMHHEAPHPVIGGREEESLVHLHTPASDDNKTTQERIFERGYARAKSDDIYGQNCQDYGECDNSF